MIIWLVGLFYIGGALGVIAGIITFAWPNQTVSEIFAAFALRSRET